MGAFSFNITASFAAEESAQAAVFVSRLADTIAQLSRSATSAPPVKTLAPATAPALVSLFVAPASAAPVAAATVETVATVDAPASSEITKRGRGRPKKAASAPDSLPQHPHDGGTSAPVVPETPTLIASPVVTDVAEPFDDSDADSEEAVAAALPPIPNKVTLQMLSNLAGACFKHSNGKYISFMKDSGIRKASDIPEDRYAEIYAKLLGMLPAEAAAKL